MDDIEIQKNHPDYAALFNGMVSQLYDDNCSKTKSSKASRMKTVYWNPRQRLQGGVDKALPSVSPGQHLLWEQAELNAWRFGKSHGFQQVLLTLVALLSITNPEKLNADTNVNPVLNQLLNPPSYSVAVFEMGGWFYRSGWSTNGFYLYSSTNINDLASLDSKKRVVGRSGDVVWRSHGGVVAMVNKATESREQVMKRVGDVWFEETMATIPAMIGITAIPINSIAAKENGTLEAVRLNGVAVTFEEIQNQADSERAVLVSYANALESRSRITAIPRQLANGSLYVCKNYLGWDKSKTNSPTQPYSLVSCAFSAGHLPEKFFLPANLFATNGVSSVAMLFSATNTLVVVDGRISKSKLIGKAPSGKTGGLWIFAIMVSFLVALAYGLSQIEKGPK